LPVIPIAIYRLPQSFTSKLFCFCIGGRAQGVVKISITSV